MKREFMKTTIKDEKGNYVQGLVPMEKTEFRVWKKGDWNDKLEKYKLDRIEKLKQSIERVQESLESNEWTDYERLMLLFYRDQLRVDLREDKHRVKYKGVIPKHIDERCVKRGSESFNKYRRWGDQFFKQLKEDIDVHFWGNVIIQQDETSGGGKI